METVYQNLSKGIQSQGDSVLYQLFFLESEKPESYMLQDLKSLLDIWHFLRHLSDAVEKKSAIVFFFLSWEDSVLMLWLLLT